MINTIYVKNKSVLKYSYKFSSIYQCLFICTTKLYPWQNVHNLFLKCDRSDVMQTTSINCSESWIALRHSRTYRRKVVNADQMSLNET